MLRLDKARLDKLNKKAEELTKRRNTRIEGGVAVYFVRDLDECAIEKKKCGRHIPIRIVPSGQFIPKDGAGGRVWEIDDALYMEPLKLEGAPERPELVYREDPPAPTDTPVVSQPPVEGEWQSDKIREQQDLLAFVLDWQAKQPTLPPVEIELPESHKHLVGRNEGTAMASPSPLAGLTGVARFSKHKPAN